MIEVGEWTLLPIVQNGIATVQADPATLIPQIFPQASTALQAQIQAALTTGSLKSVPVMLAFLPTETPQLPAIYLYGMPGGEDKSQDFIGNQWNEVPVVNSAGAITGYTTAIGVTVRKTWNFTIATTNINDLLTLVGIVQWSLIGARLSLEARPNAYIEQVLAWSGWSPMANSAGDVIFPYQQTLTFTITVVDDAQSINTDLITGYTPYSLTASD